MCERDEPKEELLEDVPVRLMRWRRDWGIMACSESLESEEFEDLGGEGPGIRRATRS